MVTGLLAGSLIVQSGSRVGQGQLVDILPLFGVAILSGVLVRIAFKFLGGGDQVFYHAPIRYHLGYIPVSFGPVTFFSRRLFHRL